VRKWDAPRAAKAEKIKDLGGGETKGEISTDEGGQQSHNRERKKRKPFARLQSAQELSYY